MKNITILPLTAFMFLMVLACKKTDTQDSDHPQQSSKVESIDIIGRWEVDYQPTFHYTFKNDGTFELAYGTIKKGAYSFDQKFLTTTQEGSTITNRDSVQIVSKDTFYTFEKLPSGSYNQHIFARDN